MEKNNNKNKTNKKDNKEKVIKTEKKEIDKDKVILSIQNASYRYSDAAEDEYALRDVSYDFEKEKYMQLEVGVEQEKLHYYL